MVLFVTITTTTSIPLLLTIYIYIQPRSKSPIDDFVIQPEFLATPSFVPFQIYFDLNLHQYDIHCPANDRTRMYYHVA